MAQTPEKIVILLLYQGKRSCTSMLVPWSSLKTTAFALPAIQIPLVKNDSSAILHVIMYIILIIAVFALLISFLNNSDKTIQALRIAGKRFKSLLLPFLTMLALVSVILTILPEKTVAQYLGNRNIWLATLGASLIGSVSIMPGFIAFPLSGILLSKGVAWMVVSAFTTTLMMVGVITFPVERAYLGTSPAIVRNVLSFLLSLTTAFVTGLYFGELL